MHTNRPLARDDLHTTKSSICPSCPSCRGRPARASDFRHPPETAPLPLPARAARSRLKRSPILSLVAGVQLQRLESHRFPLAGWNWSVVGRRTRGARAARRVNLRQEDAHSMHQKARRPLEVDAHCCWRCHNNDSNHRNGNNNISPFALFACTSSSYTPPVPASVPASADDAATDAAAAAEPASGDEPASGASYWLPARSVRTMALNPSGPLVPRCACSPAAA